MIHPILNLVQGILLFGPKKRFHHTKNDATFYAVNNARSSYWALCFFGVLSLIPIGATIEVICKQTNLSLADYIVLSITYVIGTVGSRKFLWHVLGKEHLEVNDTTLYIYKTGTFFTKDKRYPLERLINVRSREEHLQNINPYIAEKIKKQGLILRIMFRLSVGEILITYQKNTSYLKTIIYLFNYLSDDERKLIIDEVNSRIEKIKTNG